MQSDELIVSTLFFLFAISSFSSAGSHYVALELAGFAYQDVATCAMDNTSSIPLCGLAFSVDLQTGSRMADDHQMFFEKEGCCKAPRNTSFGIEAGAALRHDTPWVGHSGMCYRRPFSCVCSSSLPEDPPILPGVVRSPVAQGIAGRHLPMQPGKRFVEDMSKSLDVEFVGSS